MGRDLPEADHLLHSILTTCISKRLKSALRITLPFMKDMAAGSAGLVPAVVPVRANVNFGES
jgi:hypothetical protein